MEHLPKILFVDDYVDLVTSYQLFYKNEFEVTHAENLQEALRLLRNQLFDLLVVDYYLPDGFGTELIEEAAELNVPIILTTGDGSKVNKYGQFFNAAFFKPVDLYVLSNAIHDLLDAA
jgi:DNA-binding response OmpR family regulator